MRKEQELESIIEEQAKEISLLRVQLEKMQHGVFVDAYASVRAKAPSYIGDMHWIYYPDKRLLMFTSNYQKIFGWNKLIYTDFSDMRKLTHPEDWEIFLLNLQQVLERKNESFQYEIRYLCKDETYKWFSNHCHAFYDMANKPHCIVGIACDRTAFREQEFILQEERLKNQLLFQSSSDFIWEYDIFLKKLHLSSKFLDSMGQDSDFDIVEGVTEFLHSSCDVMKMDVYFQQDIKIYNKVTDRYSWFEIICSVLFDSKGERCKLIGTIHNVDERVYLKEAVYLDELTKVYSRRAAVECFEKIFNEYYKTKRNHAIFFLDLDNFKIINDTYGHAAGDLVLESFAKKLKNQLESLQGAVYRWGGEEFIVICPFYDQKTALEYGDTFRRSIEEMQVMWNEVQIQVTVSIGVSTFSVIDLNYHAVIQRADKGVYRAKTRGKNNVCFYELPQ